MNSEENSNLGKPQVEEQSQPADDAINNKPKKRGRKKKIQSPFANDGDYIPQINPSDAKDSKEETSQLQDSDDDDVVIISQTDKPAPKKRGRKKKIQAPSADDAEYIPKGNSTSDTKDGKEGASQLDNDDDVSIIDNPAPKKRGRKKKNVEDSDYVPPNSEGGKETENKTNNEDIKIEIKNGINDLTNLPIELLRMELIQRGYEEGVINRLDKWYLVSMLRETAFNHFNYFSFYSSRFGLNSWERNDGPMEKIFENDPETERKRLEEQRLKKEKELEDEENAFEDSSINPDDFSKEKRKYPGKYRSLFDFL